MKISIVTTNFNQGDYIKETIESVLAQEGDFQLEYIITDAGSTDNSVEIIKSYEQKFKDKGYEYKWISEKDKGMYDGILKGFEMITGDIMAWINSDDVYQPGAFKEIVKAFNSNQEILWVKGITDYIQENGERNKGRMRKYNQRLISKGMYGTVGPFIQQDSVFWRRSLWNMVNHEEIRQYSMAGDFRLWQMFAEKTPLHSINIRISYFRKRSDQKSKAVDIYTSECIKTVKYSKLEEKIYKIYFKLGKFLSLI